MEASSKLHSSTNQGPPTPNSSADLLRFPTPATDARISTWVESINAATMSARSEAPSDDGILGESAYEFVDTDEESRDGNATESVTSTDLERPDDVASLADTDHSGDESEIEDSHGTSSVPALPGAAHAVEEAFNTPTIGRSSAISLDDIDKPLAQSIEFEEPFGLGAETVSVKHTVSDLNEEQTAQALQGIKLYSPLRRIVVTIRQTMTKQGLIASDPLRLLYVGSHSAKRDIIHKIASSVTASVDGGRRTKSMRQSRSQIYNVVPVSAFGSERTPEIELMQSSGYQIKVEDCTSAQTLKFEDQPEKPDVIKLILDDSYACHSVPEGEGFIMEPSWEMPHVAIFYCSESDDVEARRTRMIARKFMSRHGIPSIVISHKQLFDRGQCMSLDQHSIHMCLESRDPNGRGNIIHQRLPIDLASFLNIDARQMNRNLAYLTGLYEPLDIRAAVAMSKQAEADVADLEKTSLRLSDSVSFIHNRNGAALWRALLPVSMLLLSVLAAVLTGIPSYRFSRASSAPVISVNSKAMSAISISVTPSITSAPPVSSITSTPKVLSTKTATRTVTVTQSIALAPGPNSLSVVSPMDLGKQATQDVTKPLNKSFCTAEVLGDREILIRIPSATKLSWLGKEAMSVNITRYNITVPTERAYTSDDGIILQLPRKEAYGILNISIVTTKKPRVNETFQVDFGNTASHIWDSFLETLSSFIPEDIRIGDPELFSHMRETAKCLTGEASDRSQSTFDQVEQARMAAMEQAALVGSSLTELAKSMTLEAAKQSAILSKEVALRYADAQKKVSQKMGSIQHLREPLDDNLEKAQVQSRLLWLKLQGKEQEYRDYERRAAAAGHHKAQHRRYETPDAEARQVKAKTERVRKHNAVEKEKPGRATKKATKRTDRETRKAAKAQT